MIGLTIPTPDAGPPIERDEEIAAIAAATVKQLLRRGARFRINGATRKLDPTDIGISSTHRAMNSALDFAPERSSQQGHRGYTGTLARPRTPRHDHRSSTIRYS